MRMLLLRILRNLLNIPNWPLRFASEPKLRYSLREGGVLNDLRSDADHVASFEDTKPKFERGQGLESTQETMKLLPNFRRSQKESQSQEVSGMLRFVRERKHFAIMYVLLSEEVKVDQLFNDCSRALGEPFLHYMLKTCQPNPELVELVLAKLGGCDAIATDDALLDNEGRTALHIAAAYGCEVSVLQILMEGEGRIQASVQDDRKRTPLHWACLSPSGVSKGSSSKVSKAALNNMLDCVAVLLEADPSAIHILDKDGRNPLDVAKEQKADKKILAMLEGALQGEPKWLERGFNGSTELTIPSCVSEDDLLFDNSDLSSIGWEE